MAVYEAFSYCVSYRYRTTVCTNTTLFLIVTSLMTVISPFLIAYRTYGFWLKSDTYREQPDVLFKHQYIVVVETDKIDSPIFCSTFPNLNRLLKGSGHCSVVKSREEDYNGDGRQDELRVEFHILIHNSRAIHSVQLFLLFDYQLHKMSLFRMESLGLIQYNSPLPGARLDVIADLKLVQRTPLRHRGRDFRYNSSIVDTDNGFPESFNFHSMLLEYSKRNVSTQLDNLYPLWTTGRIVDVPFIISATIRYPEEVIIYTPGFWQVMKWAWMQYLSMLVIFIYIFHSIKIYMFSNHLLSTVRDVPWKKIT